MGFFNSLFGGEPSEEHKKWTKAISLQTVYMKSISFHVNRFEEWTAGQCINRGPLNFDIHLIAKNESINVEIPDSKRFKIHDNFSFPFLGSDVLEDRVQYVNAPGDSTDPTKPIILHIFVKADKIEYIRFAMSFPDRIIEFYGEQIESVYSCPDDFSDVTILSPQGYKLTFLSSLVDVAICDGNITNEEMNILQAFIQREGLSEADLVKAINAPNHISREVPQSPALRAQHLRDIVALSIADGHFRPQEYNLCRQIAVRLGFFPEVIDFIRREFNG